jgi:hypothetical protein
VVIAEHGPHDSDLFKKKVWTQILRRPKQYIKLFAPLDLCLDNEFQHLYNNPPLPPALYQIADIFGPLRVRFQYQHGFMTKPWHLYQCRWLSLPLLYMPMSCK